ncbi:hypothetical protein [Aeromonas salmonicida]|uniref:hypothetical protein n=1 Tax=Aeromonas salmonicida TaxID=645 RepID=UPI00232DE7D1|nr:hypothetical protein [Aeromonas salmonicida]WCH23634.1 hypothetical protein ONZ54_04540 [Aeromonas salmonicida]
MPPINGVNTATPTITAHTANTDATTPIGQATSASVSFNEGPNTHKERAMYAPFPALDMVRIAAFENATRRRNGKTEAPLICGNQAELEGIRQGLISVNENAIKETLSIINEIQYSIENPVIWDPLDSAEDSPEFWDPLDSAEDSPEYWDKLDSGEIIPDRKSQFAYLQSWELEALLVEQTEDLDMLSSVVDALKNLTIETSDALKLLSPGQHKLYVLGHGEPGSDVLSADSECRHGMVTAMKVAHLLAEQGLNKGFRDVRVTSCFSADTCVPTSFKEPALYKASQPLFAPNGDVVAEPFAQTLSNEMKRVGFEQPRVSGYHGAGLSSIYAEHHQYCLPDTQEPVVRASIVRQVFIPA